LALELTIRCATLTSATEPNGVLLYSTLRDDNLGEILFAINQKSMVKADEDGVRGLSKGGIRRLYLDSERAYDLKNCCLFPMPRSKEGKRILDRVFQNKADLIVKVKVLLVKNV